MTKQNDIEELSTLLDSENFENIFNLELDESGSYYYNTLRSISFPDNIDPDSYTEYTTVPGDTWPFIAWKEYNNVKLWWVICSVNNIINPVAQPEPGIVLKILDINIVDNILQTIRFE